MTEFVEGSLVSFALAPIESGAAVAVTRSVSASHTGTFEQIVIFRNRRDFDRWIEEDEFRDPAPRLMQALRTAFDGLFKPGIHCAVP